MRIAIGGIMHESNTFNPSLTTLPDFSVQRCDEIAVWWAKAHHEVGGFLEGAARFDFEPVPLLMASATPGGPVSAPAFEALLQEMVALVRKAHGIDGLLLALHGAMVSERFADADGEILRRLRRALGREFPIVVTHDLHANISEALVRDCTALIAYKTYPHLDHRERGLQAAEIIARTVRREVRPIVAIEKPPILINIVRQYTSAEPIRQIMQAVCDAEHQPGVLAASLAEGYQYADVDEMGPSFVVVTDDNPALARHEAQRLAQLLLDRRHELTIQLPDAKQAVAQARSAEVTPVVLVDLGDNIGGGSPGDSTFILHELISQHAEGWVVVLADPEAVRTCAQAGIGQVVTLAVGAKCDTRHGAPAMISGHVKCLHDGRYLETQPRHGGLRYHDQGLSAVIEIAGSAPDRSSYLALTSRREPPFSLEQLVSLGIQPQAMQVLVVKAAVAFRAAYEPIAARIIEVDTAGVTAVNPTRFTYNAVRPELMIG